MQIFFLITITIVDLLTWSGGTSRELPANYIEGADGVGNDNIPTARATPWKGVLTIICFV